MAIRIFIAEKDDLLRLSLRLVLQREKDFQVVGETTGTADAIDEIVSSNATVVIVDTRLQMGSGIEFAKELRRKAPFMPIIVITAYAELEILKQAISIGANAFIPITAPNEMLITAIRGVDETGYWSDPTVISMLGTTLAHRR